MNIKECYEQLGENYSEVLDRFQRDALVERFALKFLEDKSFNELTDFLHENKVEEAFRAAHTLKGVCINLGFKKLFSVSSEITEMLRAGDLEAAKEFYPSVAAGYNDVVVVLKQYQLSK